MRMAARPPSAGARSSVLRSSRVPAVRVLAVQSKGKTPETPDPFDRHSSNRDKAGQEFSRPSSKSRSNMFASANRRRGRPAHMRSPDDSPLRDGNRDRLIGLLTERAAKTLLVYLQETNPTVYHWLFVWMKENPVPLTGTWDEISGEVFLRKMLSTPAETAKIELGRGELFDNIASTGVDPRHMAQRIMEIRVQLSKEFMQDLAFISDENSVLLRETLHVSLANTLHKEPIKQLPPRDLSNVFVHPELLAQDGTLHPEVASSHPELLPVVEQQEAERKRVAQASSPSPAPSTTSPPPAPPAAPVQPRSSSRNSPARSRGAPTNPSPTASRTAAPKPAPPSSKPPPTAANTGAGSEGPHVVNMQPPTRKVTGPWKFSGLKGMPSSGQDLPGQQGGGAGPGRKPAAGEDVPGSSGPGAA